MYTGFCLCTGLLWMCLFDWIFCLGSINGILLVCIELCWKRSTCGTTWSSFINWWNATCDICHFKRTISFGQFLKDLRCTLLPYCWSIWSYLDNVDTADLLSFIIPKWRFWTSFERFANVHRMASNSFEFMCFSRLPLDQKPWKLRVWFLWMSIAPPSLCVTVCFYGTLRKNVGNGDFMKRFW